MISVVTSINNIGVHVEHIPAGCTSLEQPVDIRVNLLFKTRLNRQ